MRICVSIFQQYHKKRVDREKGEVKRKEKELEESRKVVKLLDGVLRPQLKSVQPLKPKSVGATTTVGSNSPLEAIAAVTPSSGSKRNLSSRMLQAESEAKRLRLENKPPIPTGKNTSSSKAIQTKGGKQLKQGSQGSKQLQKITRSSPVKSPRHPVKYCSERSLFVSSSVATKDSASPMKTDNSKACMESLFFAAGLEVCNMILPESIKCVYNSASD